MAEINLITILRFPICLPKPVWWNGLIISGIPEIRESFSALHFILSKRSLRWAFWLTLILLFLLMFLVESKRKQRPIAEIPALRNASEDFVKTVGRLYFQQKNNQNLAAKMVAAFLENIRSTYNLSYFRSLMMNLPTSSLFEPAGRSMKS